MAPSQSKAVARRKGEAQEPEPAQEGWVRHQAKPEEAPGQPVVKASVRNDGLSHYFV